MEKMNPKPTIPECDISIFAYNPVTRILTTDLRTFSKYIDRGLIQAFTVVGKKNKVDFQYSHINHARKNVSENWVYYADYGGDRILLRIVNDE